MDLERVELRSRDGVRVIVHRGGNALGSPVLLVNAYGMPVDAFAPLVERLAEQHQVVTYQSRGVPSLHEPVEPKQLSVAHHVEDLELVAQAIGTPVTLVGWCTGARVALAFTARRPSLVRRLVCVNGFFSLPLPRPMTAWELRLRSVLRYVIDHPDKAQLVVDVLAETIHQRLGIGSASVVASWEAGIVPMIATPYRTPQGFLAFAHMLNELMDDALDVAAHRVDVPTLLVTGTEDRLAHPEESRRLALELPRAMLLQLPGGTHFDLITGSDTAAIVHAFLADAEAAPEGTRAVRAAS